jgi:hypothetical protein
VDNNEAKIRTLGYTAKGHTIMAVKAPGQGVRLFRGYQAKETGDGYSWTSSNVAEMTPAQLKGLELIQARHPNFYRTKISAALGLNQWTRFALRQLGINAKGETIMMVKTRGYNTEVKFGFVAGSSDGRTVRKIGDVELQALGILTPTEAWAKATRVSSRTVFAGVAGAIKIIGTSKSGESLRFGVKTANPALVNQTHGGGTTLQTVLSRLFRDVNVVSGGETAAPDPSQSYSHVVGANN